MSCFHRNNNMVVFNSHLSVTVRISHHLFTPFSVRSSQPCGWRPSSVTSWMDWVLPSLWADKLWPLLLSVSCVTPLRFMYRALIFKVRGIHIYLQPLNSCQWICIYNHFLWQLYSCTHTSMYVHWLNVFSDEVAWDGPNLLNLEKFFIP